MRRWFAVMSVVAIAAVGALSALPVGAGTIITPIEPNCVVELVNGNATAQQGELFPALCTEVQVTKVVTGDPALGTTFDVVVECQEPSRRFESDPAANVALPQGLVGPFEETLTFGEEGGTQSLLVGGGSDCTVSEVAPPGCELVNINPEEFDIDFAVFVNGQAVAPEPGSVLAVTVTNDCPAAAAVAAPVAVEITPTFTG